MGGFGGSKALYSYLKEVLENEDEYEGINLVCPVLL